MIDHVQNKWINLDEGKQAAISLTAFIATLVSLTCILYSPFIFGDHLLIYAGSGSDSIGQTIPFMLNEASRLSNGDFSQWNQYQFLGATTIQHFNPDYFPALFGEEAVPSMMLVSQLAKVILAGLFFYLFLGYYHLQYKTRFVSGLGFAFCGRMIELAPWTAYTLEVTLFACMLWGFERFFANRKKVLVLPLAFGLIGMGEGFYALVLYGFILAGYALFRSCYSSDAFKNKRELAGFGAQFAVLMCAGVLVSLPVILPSVEMYSSSSRISSDVGNSGFALLSLLLPTSTTICSEEIVKFFSSAILGHMDSFSGSTCILNSPYYYAGVLPLFGIGFAFNQKNKQQKIAMALILFLCVFYCYSDGFRYILNGFSVPGDDFRQSSFWVVAVIALIGAIGLDNMWRNISKKHLCLWSAFLLFAFLAASFSIWEEISRVYFAVTIVLLALYFLFFYTASEAKAPLVARVAICLIVITAPVEYLVQNYRAIQHTTNLTNEEYNAQLGSNPEDCILALGKTDTDIYRIDYKTMMLTRSMAATYLGTQAYIGGAGMTQSVTDFMKTLDNDYIDQLGYSRYSYGFFNPSTNALLGVKYLVYPKADAQYYIPYGYQEIGNNDKYTVLINTKALPLMFAYGENETISVDSYLQLDRGSRSTAMLRSAVLPNGSNEPQIQQQHDAETIAKSADIVTVDSPATIFIPETDSEWLEAKMDLRAAASVSGSVTANITFFDNENNAIAVVPFYTAAGNEQINIQVKNKRISRATVEFVATNACPNPQIENIRFSACGSNYFSVYDDAVNERMSKSATVHSYKDGCLNASIKISENGYLATTIPWSKNWILKIDGEAVETFPINIGFVGCDIAQGSHSIELIYDSATLNTGIALSASTLLVLVSLPLIRLLASTAQSTKKRERN